MPTVSEVKSKWEQNQNNNPFSAPLCNILTKTVNPSLISFAIWDYVEMILSAEH